MLLGAMGDKKSLSTIVPLLEVDAIRPNVVMSLVHLDAKEQVGKIIDHFNTAKFCPEAAYAIYLLGDPEEDAEKIGLHPLHPENSNHDYAACLLGKWNRDEAIPRLKTLTERGYPTFMSLLHMKLKSSNPKNRAYALECLSVKVNDPIVNDWISTMIKTEENEELRKKATELLGR